LEASLSAQISVYTLPQEHLSPAIDAVKQALETSGLQSEIGAMNTIVIGEAQDVLVGLQEAFDRAAATGHVVMTVTVSNACPI
jgi:uncharacterized protein YqgV (UPF0045/DUF77 family)